MWSIQSLDYSQDVGSTSTAILDANPFRIEATLVNDSDEAIYLSKGDKAVMNTGIRLNSGGGHYTIDKNNPYYGKISAICNSGSKKLCAQETSYGYQ